MQIFKVFGACPGIFTHQCRDGNIGSTSIDFPMPDTLSESERWDVETKGLRVMEVVTDIPTTIANLHEVCTSTLYTRSLCPNTSAVYSELV